MTRNLADERPDVANQGLAILEQWHGEMMRTSTVTIDPMQIVLREGGPYHTRDDRERYCARLRESGRAHHAEALERTDGGYLG